MILDGLGVNIHFTDPQPGEIKMLADAGFRWVRMDFKWDATEKQRGLYDFSAYDRLMTALEPFHIRALFILDYGNPLYDNGAPPRTESARQAFVRWAAAAAKTFSGRGVIWEVYNEPNLATFWPPRPNVDEYIALALAVGRAFRSEVPNEKLIGPATSGIDFPFLEACFKAGLLDYWSAVSVHPYRRSDPEAAANDYCRLRKMIAVYRTRSYRTRSGSDGVVTQAKDVPIISSEWGYSSVWRGMSDEKQGEMFAREMLTNIANYIPISIWYDWRDDGLDPNEPEHNFGLVRNSYQDGRDQVFEPKPAYLAAKTLSECFHGYAYQRRLSVGSESDYVLVFGKGDELHIAAWTTSGSAHRVVIQINEGHFKITRHTGESAGLTTSGPQGLELTISNATLYLAQQPAL
ncbi:MAG TPA: cellulase family glycosylhydrolase [Pyrinomonadaceae bacterium]|nr:cellulase family glycosylhydrolase [Pyrinomonadaceae bacterium]